MTRQLGKGERKGVWIPEVLGDVAFEFRPLAIKRGEDVVIANYAFSIMATLALWVNTVGFHFQPSAALYVLALTWLLVLGWLIFVQNLELFVGGTTSR